MYGVHSLKINIQGISLCSSKVLAMLHHILDHILRSLFSFWITRLGGLDSDGKKLTLDNVCRSFCSKKVWAVEKYSLKHYVSLILQEEDIPELEIDIDELLELSDEGQRSRLQVKAIYLYIQSFMCYMLFLIDTWQHSWLFVMWGMCEQPQESNVCCGKEMCSIVNEPISVLC